MSIAEILLLQKSRETSFEFADTSNSVRSLLPQESIRRFVKYSMPLREDMPMLLMIMC